jgi:hypothetical protein
LVGRGPTGVRGKSRGVSRGKRRGGGGGTVPGAFVKRLNQNKGFKVSSRVRGTLQVVSKEYIGYTPANAVNHFTIRPGASGIARLDQFGSLYELYHISRFTVYYRPAVGTTTAGMMHLALDYDANDIPGTIAAVSQLDPVETGPVYSPLQLSGDPMRMNKGKAWLYCQAGPAVHYDITSAMAVCYANTSDVQAGEVWCEYDITFAGPVASSQTTSKAKAQMSSLEWKSATFGDASTLPSASLLTTTTGATGGLGNTGTTLADIASNLSNVSSGVNPLVAISTGISGLDSNLVYQVLRNMTLRIGSGTSSAALPTVISDTTTFSNGAGIVDTHNAEISSVASTGVQTSTVMSTSQMVSNNDGMLAFVDYYRGNSTIRNTSVADLNGSYSVTVVPFGYIPASYAIATNVTRNVAVEKPKATLENLFERLVVALEPKCLPDSVIKADLHSDIDKEFNRGGTTDDLRRRLHQELDDELNQRCPPCLSASSSTMSLE